MISEIHFAYSKIRIWILSFVEKVNPSSNMPKMINIFQEIMCSIWFGIQEMLGIKDVFIERIKVILSFYFKKESEFIRNECNK